jgi:hypothetical protein
MIRDRPAHPLAIVKAAPVSSPTSSTKSAISGHSGGTREMGILVLVRVAKLGLFGARSSVAGTPALTRL